MTGALASLDRSGSASWPVHPSTGYRGFQCRGWLTHGDLVLEAQVDFLAVVEHRLIPARVRSEWTRLGRKGLATDTSHVGNADVGVITIRGTPVVCLRLPLLSSSVFLTLVVLSGACFLSVVEGL